jgi:TPP-dependent pyruvate/acetoin dehydrogenase alpha subunit
MQNAKLYEQMALIRSFEERLLHLFDEGLLSGTTHTCIGQEAISVSVINHLSKHDLVFSSHRCHGHYLTYADDPIGLLAEIMGKEGGVCAGRGGSQHLCAGHFFSYGIQGGYLATAVGMALAEKTRQSNAIVVAFIGDGTLGQGTVYEALNMASLFRVPLLIVIENNYYAQTTSIQDNLAGSIEKRATAFDLSYGEISSNDAQELYPRFEKLCDHVRRNSVCHVETVNTYRLNAHSKGDDYRDPSEIARWKKSDPLLIAAKTINSTVKSEIDQRISDRLASVQISVDNMPFASL